VVLRHALAAQGFARHYGSLYTSILDPGGAIANRYGVVSPPQTFVINAKGRVVVTLVGPVRLSQVECGPVGCAMTVLRSFGLWVAALVVVSASRCS